MIKHSVSEKFSKVSISRVRENDKLLTKTSGSVTNWFDAVELFPKSSNSILFGAVLIIIPLSFRIFDSSR